MASKKATANVVSENMEDRSGPIIAFRSQKELDETAKWWIKKLGLEKWFISCSVIPLCEMEMPDAVGENLLTFDNLEAIIHIAKYDDINASLSKVCQEKILVHELLHCLYNFMKPPSTYEGKFLDVIDHVKLEELAKTLIMVKYDLDYDWFRL